MYVSKVYNNFKSLQSKEYLFRCTYFYNMINAKYEQRHEKYLTVDINQSIKK